ncbi:MAG: hypothetical protein LBQ52_04030 [Helicobacteraceae bacterium]|jgi:hypothetical protein|nr:hypothetical protein [Helicobacteraceae bacterium]
MRYEVIRRLTQEESDFLLGKQYISLSAKGTGKESGALIEELKNYLRQGYAEGDKAKFYDFLIELCSLTFLLYKWGALLFHLEQGAFGDWVLTIEVEGRSAIAIENNGALILETIDNGEILFRSDHNQKSALFSVLLTLMLKRTALEILSFEKDSQKFDGNHISFNVDRKEAQADQIEWIKVEFFRYKKRLDDLQKLFIDNFGRPNGVL